MHGESKETSPLQILKYKIVLKVGANLRPSYE